jgi:hypothetical protein
MNQDFIGNDTQNTTTNKTNENSETSNTIPNTLTRLDTAETINKNQLHSQNSYDTEEQQGRDITGIEISDSITIPSETSSNQQNKYKNSNRKINNKNRRKQTVIRLDEEPPAQTRIQQTLPQYNTTPNRRNEPWGASIHNLPPITFRIYFQNINSLQLKTNHSRWKQHLE